jgi:predicted HTH transcriptional regulator
MHDFFASLPYSLALFSANIPIFLLATNTWNFLSRPYLLADNNNVSIKVAKYKGLNRVNLIENNDYGFCSLIKACKLVLDKVEIENKTLSQITSKERIDRRLWNAVALREVVVNAMVHNDFTYEVSPKFEIFDDRIEITSYGGLPQGLSEEEFFEGFSLPRNKELMRVFRDVDLVEFLGSGLPRILESYGTKCFKFSDNFLRVTLPVTTEQVTEHDTEHDTEQVKDTVSSQVEQNTITDTTTATITVTTTVEKLLFALTKDMLRQEIQDKIGLTNKVHFLQMYLNPAIKQGLIERTIPDKPNSPLQKYRITSLGLEVRNKLLKNMQA